MRGVFSALFLSIILLLSPGHAYCEQIVRIRIISAKDGQPLKDQPVSISLLYERTEKAPPNTDTHVQLQTDANGEECCGCLTHPPHTLALRCSSLQRATVARVWPS